MLRIGLRDIYYKIEDKWFGAIDSLDKKGVPSYKLIDPLEKRGIPSLPVYVALLIIILYLVFTPLLLIGTDPMPPEEVFLTIRVRDFEDGSALEGATVSLFFEGEEKEFGYTEEDGRVRLLSETGNTYQIKAHRDDPFCEENQKTYTVQEEDEEIEININCKTKTAPGEIEVLFEPPGVGYVSYDVMIEGEREDTKDCGFATNCVIGVEDIEDDYRYFFHTETHEAETTITGSQLIKMDGEEPIQMRYIDDDYPNGDEHKGTVTTWIKEKNTGRPIPGTTVRLLESETKETIYEKETKTTQAEKGSATFTGLEPGKKFLVETPADEKSGYAISEEVYEVPGAGKFKEVILEVEDKENTTFEVLEEDTAPPKSIKNALITIKDGEGELKGSRYTDSDGKATIKLEEGETYTASIYKPYYGIKLMEIIGGAEETVMLEKLEEDEAVDIALQIETEPDEMPGDKSPKKPNPEHPAEVSLIKENSLIATLETNEEGIVTFRGMGEGKYDVEVYWEETRYGTEETPSYEVSFPETERDISDVIRLSPPTYELYPHIIGNDGKEVDEAEVLVTWESQGGTESYELGPRETDFTGTLEEPFEIVFRDKVTLQASKEIVPGLEEKITRDIKMERNKEPKLILDTAPPDMGIVTANLKNEEEEPIANANVNLVDAVNKEAKIPGESTGETDEEGSVTFTDLFAGTNFEIEVESGKTGYYLSSQNYTVPKEINITINEGELEESTIVVEDEEGNTLYNAEVSVYKEGDHQGTEKTIDGESTFNLYPLKEYEVNAWKEGYTEDDETIQGGEDTTLTLKEIDDPVTQVIYVDSNPDAQYGNKVIPFEKAEVTLENIAERTKEADEDGRVEFKGLKDNTHYTIHVDWKGEHYSEAGEITVLEEPWKEISLPLPKHNLIVTLLGTDYIGKGGEDVTIYHPIDPDEEPELEETKTTGGAGQVAFLDKVVHGDRVRVQAEWEEGGVEYTPTHITDPIMTDESVNLSYTGENIDNKMYLAGIKGTGTDDYLNETELESGLMPGAWYEADFHIELDYYERGWDKINFTLERDDNIAEFFEPSLPSQGNWNWKEKEDYIEIIGTDIEEDGTDTIAINFLTEYGAQGDSIELDSRVEWERTGLYLDNSHIASYDISDRDEETAEGFEIIKQTKEKEDDETEWRGFSPKPEYGSEETAMLKYELMRVDEESFEGTMNFSIADERENALINEAKIEIDKIGEEAEDFTDKVVDEHLSIEGGHVILDYDGYPLDTGDKTTIILETEPLFSAQEKVITTGMINNNEVDELEAIYSTGGKIPIKINQVNRKDRFSLSNSLTIPVVYDEMGRAGKRVDKDILSDQDLLHNSKITGDLKGCPRGKIALDNRNRVEVTEDGRIEVEFDGDCHYKPEGEIEISIQGGDVKRDESTFSIISGISLPSSGPEIGTEEICRIDIDTNEEIGQGRVIPGNPCDDEDSSSTIEIMKEPQLDVEMEIEEIKRDEERVSIDEVGDNWFSFSEIPGSVLGGSVKDRLTVVINVKNAEEEGIYRTLKLNFNARIDFLSSGDMSPQLFRPEPLQSYDGSPNCNENYCNLDQFLEYSLRLEESSIGLLIGQARMDSVDIEETLRTMGKLNDKNLKWGNLSEIENVNPGDDDTVIINDLSMPKTGLNTIVRETGEIENEDEVTEYDYLEFVPSPRGEKYFHYPHYMGLWIPNIKNVPDNREKMHKTPIYLDETINENNISIDHENLEKTLKEAWGNEPEIKTYEGENDLNTFRGYDHGIEIGVCTAERAVDVDLEEMSEMEVENCNRIMNRTEVAREENDPTEPMIFKTSPDRDPFGDGAENTIHIYANNEEDLELLIESFHMAFGERKTGALRIENEEFYDAGYLTFPPEDVYYYAYNEEHGTDWLEQEEAEDVRDELKKVIAAETPGISEVEVALKNVEKITEDKEQWAETPITWLIVQCNNEKNPYTGEDQLDKCWDQDGVPSHITSFKDTFGSNARIPPGGILYQPTEGNEESPTKYGPRTILVPEESENPLELVEGMLRQYGGVN